MQDRVGMSMALMPQCVLSTMASLAAHVWHHRSKYHWSNDSGTQSRSSDLKSRIRRPYPYERAAHRQEWVWPHSFLLLYVDICTQEICATLLTLHILESRPLAETLSIFLTQRSKTLASALSRPKELANGHANAAPSDHGKTTARARKLILREVKRNLQTALEAISHTLRSARDIFSDTVSGEPGMMQCALQYIQDEKAAGSLPPELQMTTRALLNSLPSSAHFSLLPDTIRSYKPYIGATSSSSSVTQSLLQQKLGEWLTRSLETIQAVATKWLASLETVKEVWDIRASSFTIIAKLHGLDPHEQARFRAIVDSLCQQQTVSVWQTALRNTASSFNEHLTSAVQSLKSISEESISGRPPMSAAVCGL